MFQEAASQLSRSWKYHCLESVEIETHPHYNKAGRPTKNQSPEYCTYGVTAQVVPVESAIEIARRRAGRFVLATNVLDEDVLSNDEVLIEYKGEGLESRRSPPKLVSPVSKVLREAFVFSKILYFLLPVFF